MTSMKTTLLVASLALLASAPPALAAGRRARTPARSVRARVMARPRARVRARPEAHDAVRRASTQRLRANKLTLSPRDEQQLRQTASRFESEIRRKYTPVVNIMQTEASQRAGVTFRTVGGPMLGEKGPQIIEVRGTENTNGVVEFVMSGGASGHVMQSHYGGRALSVVEQYGRTDTVFLTHKKPGASTTEPLVKVQSRGLVTQEGVKVQLSKGEHTLYYFRRGANESSGGEGSEPELREIRLRVL